LKKELEKVRKDGFAYSNQELEIGARAIAAPIKDYTNKVISGLSVVGPIYRFSKEKIEKFVPLVREYAEKISLAVGYRPPIN